MTSYLHQQNICIFDYAKFVEPFREQIRDNAERLAKESGIAIEFVRSGKNFRKETRIQAILKERGEAPGSVLPGRFGAQDELLLEHHAG